MEQNSKQKVRTSLSIQSQLIKAAKTGDADFIKFQLKSGFDVHWTQKDGTSLLMIAAKKGNTECVKALIAAGADVDKANNGGRTAVMLCSEKGKVDCLKELIKSGANVNRTTEIGGSEFTALKCAAGEGQTECIRQLIAAGACVNKADDGGMTPIFLSAVRGELCNMKELIKAGADVNKVDMWGDSPLLYAADRYNTNCVKELLAAGADVNHENEEGDTALMGCSKAHVYHEEDTDIMDCSKAACMEALIQAGADVDAQNNDGNTALINAASDAECLKLLIVAGADVNKEGEDGKTALMLGTCTKELIAAGADLNKRDEFGYTALMFKAENSSDPDGVNQLIAAGAKLNITDQSGRTALYLSCIGENLDSTRKLISAGADVSITDNYGVTALGYTAGEGKTDCLKELIAVGADVNKPDKSRKTPLMRACQHDHPECVKELVAAGCDLNAKDYCGETALQICNLPGQINIAKQLISAGCSISSESRNLVFVAAAEKDIGFARKLLDEGTDVNMQDSRGQTPLMAATRSGNVDWLITLIKAGANVNELSTQKNTSEECTPLISATLAGNSAVIRELIRAGAEVNTRTGNGSALTIASYKNQIDCVKELINAGADVNETDEEGNTLLLQVAQMEQYQLVEEFICAGCDVNMTNNLGFTALMVASTNGSVDIVQKLIGCGADVNIENNAGETALFLATDKGHKVFSRPQEHKDIRNDQTDAEKSSTEEYCEIVCELLKAGAHLKSSRAESNPCTAHLPAEKSHCESITSMLYAAGGQMEDQEKIETRLKIKDNLDLSNLSIKVIRKQLLEAHQDENLYFTTSKLGLPSRLLSLLLCRQTFSYLSEEQALNADEETLLDSTRRGNLRSLELLLKSKVNVDARNQNGDTALMLASHAGNNDCVQYLIDAGANVNQQNVQLETALHFAVKHNYVDYARGLPDVKSRADALEKAKNYLKVAKKLITANSEINLKDRDGFTALDESVKISNDHMIDLLIQNGADVNSVSSSGSTALFHAARIGDLDTLKKLIAAGANPNIQDKTGSSALYEAVANNSTDCVKELIKEGADVNPQRKDRRTPLMEACSKNALKSLQEMIQAGADVNKQDEAGNTALIVSVSNEDDNCLKELIKSGADLNIRNKEGWTAISSAWEREKSCQILWESGAEVDTAWLTSVVKERNKLQTDVYLKKTIRFNFQPLFRNLVSEKNQKAFDDQITEADEKIERLEDILQVFFNLGVIPDQGKDQSQVQWLQYGLQSLGYKSPLRLSTISKAALIEDLQDIVALRTRCPATVTKQGRTYQLTVNKGEAISLGNENSEVELQIAEGCPMSAYLMEVITNLQSRTQLENLDDECFISPVVEVLAPARTETSAYLLKLPHCLDEGHDRNKVKVRMINENMVPAVVEVPSRDKRVGAGPFYDIDPHFIELHTSHFCVIMATYTKKICLDRSVNFFFGKFEASLEDGVRMNEVQIRPYFCSILYARIQDFRENLKHMVPDDLSYIVERNMVLAEKPFNPESSIMGLNLVVKGQQWQPPFPHESWNNGQFTLKKSLVEILNICDEHVCRLGPTESEVYNLENEGEEISRFRAQFTADLTAQLLKEAEEEGENKYSNAEGALSLQTKSSSMRVLLGLSRGQMPAPLPAVKRKLTLLEPTAAKKKRQQRLSAEEIKKRIQETTFHKTQLYNAEFVHLAQCFSPHTLVDLALTHFNLTQAEVDSIEYDSGDAAAFKRTILYRYSNKTTGHERRNIREDLYRIVLTAESEGRLDDMDAEDLVKVEGILLNPK